MTKEMNESKRPEASPGAGAWPKPSGSNSKDILAQRTNIYLDNGKPVGYVERDTFYKHVKASIHQLRIPPAWACDVTILEQVEELGTIWMVLIDDETKLTWKTSIQAFWGKGSFEINRGYGRQRVLPLEYWHISGENTLEQLTLL